MKQHRGNRQVAVLAALLAGAAGGAYAAEGRRDRLAVWGFRAAADDAQGASLGERLRALTEVELARRGAEVVERRGFDRILTEHKLAFTQFADARKAVRAGKLVRADVVLVGSVLKARREEGRIVTMKAVETKTGKVLDACAAWVPHQDVRGAARHAAGLVMSAPGRKLTERVFVAVGGFEDLSMSDRFADLGGKIRAGLVDEFSKDAAFTVLEREHVEPLLLELGLSKSALAAPGFGETDAAPAFLVVDGLYQVYHAQGVRVRLNLRLQKPGGACDVNQMDAAPGAPLLRSAAKAIRSYAARAPKRRRVAEDKLQEAEVHYKRGCEQARLYPRPKKFDCSSSAVLGGYFRKHNPGQKDGSYKKRVNNVRNGISSFESALLLNPKHRFARLHLSACLMDPDIGEFERARQLLQELAAEARGEREGLLALLYLGQSYYLAGWKKAPSNASHPCSDAVEADYRAAIRIWSRLVEQLETGYDRLRVHERVINTAGQLRRRGRMSAAEYAGVVTARLDAHCGAVVDKPHIADHACLGMKACWKQLAELYGEDAWDRCFALEGQLRGRHPSVSHILRFSLADAFGFEPGHLQMVEGALRDILQRPGELAGRDAAAKYIFPTTALLYARLGRWEDALFYAEHLGTLLASRPKGRATDLRRARAKVLKAYCCEGAGRLQEAVGIYEELGDVEIHLPSKPMWREALGRSIVVRQALDRCRVRLRQEPEAPTVATVPLGGFRAVSLERFDVSALAVVGGALWIGTGPTGGRILPRCAVDANSSAHRRGWLYRGTSHAGGPLKCTPLSFGRTNDPEALDGPGPLPAWVTSIWPTKGSVYVGTFGTGLYEFDRQGRPGRRWTHEDGLIDDRVSSLAPAGSDRLWVGFARRLQGGLGAFDLTAKRFESYSPLLHRGTLKSPEHPGWPQTHGRHYDKPPRAAVTGMARDSDGGMWVTVYGIGLKHYDRFTGKWDTATDKRDFGGEKMPSGGHYITDGQCALTCVAVGRLTPGTGGAVGDLVAVGAGVTGWSGRSFQAGCVDIYDTSARKWSHIRRGDGLPDANVYSLAFQGDTLWIGGHGYVAAYDTRESRLVRVYEVPRGKDANALCVDGDTLWVGAGNKVYRITVPGGPSPPSRGYGRAGGKGGRK